MIFMKRIPHRILKLLRFCFKADMPFLAPNMAVSRCSIDSRVVVTKFTPTLRKCPTTLSRTEMIFSQPKTAAAAAALKTMIEAQKKQPKIMAAAVATPPPPLLREV